MFKRNFYMKKLSFLLSIFFALHSFAQTDSLPASVYHWDSLAAKKTATGESRPLLQGHTTDLASLKIHTSTLNAGMTNHPLQAYNDRDEVIVVKEGQVKVTINDSSKIIGPGSIVLIVAGDKQSFQNVSDKPVTYCVLQFYSTLPVNIERGKKGGGSLIKDFTELTVKKTDKGESRPVFDRPTSMFPRFEIHATTLKPGFDSHPPHTHRQEEIMLLLKGNVTMHIANASLAASKGDVIFVSPNIPHNLSNTGKEQCWYYAMKWYNEL